MIVILCLIFFLSGTSALIFETLWFRLAGITFGSSVLSTSLVLSSFMGGLAIGNGWMASRGNRIKKPIMFYAKLEATIGVVGFALVVLFPHLTRLVAPFLKTLSMSPSLNVGVRFLLAFALLIIPTMAMGATLPTLIKALMRHNKPYGNALGKLYGWNTLGATLGALGGELFLFEALGLQGTGYFALALNILVALLALYLSRTWGESAPEPSLATRPSHSRHKKVLLATALSGFILLALEVVWFRFSLMFVIGNSLNFSVMLAVVLSGIGIGGLVAGRCSVVWPQSRCWTPVVALASALLVSILYAVFDLGGFSVLYTYGSGFWFTFKMAMRLMFPVALLSGVLFTFMGMQLKQHLHESTKSTGMLTLFNTSGGMLGSLVAQFMLLPLLGIERSILVLATLYILVAVLTIEPKVMQSRALRLSIYATGTSLITTLIFFPIGLMESQIIPSIVYRQAHGSSEKIIAYEEGVNETVILSASTLGGRNTSYRLITNGHSMSGTGVGAKRYMNAYVYLPVALRPNPKSALLISYGVGNTAKCLVDNTTLEQVDIVDISRGVLRMSRHIYGNDNPLDSAKVTVTIEDGRHYLLLTDQSYDLITAEPPPPKNSGIVNLYSKEYFQLAYDRLNDQGMISYWLPVHSLTLEDSKSITRAFLDVFSDASLWSGSGVNWMLVGSKNLSQGPSRDDFESQWHDAETRTQLESLGFDDASHLAITFLADSEFLRSWTEHSKPLVDNFPLRLSIEPPTELDENLRQLMNYADCQQRFKDSKWIQQFIPNSIRDAALNHFGLQRYVNQVLAGEANYHHSPNYWNDLSSLLANQRAPFLVLWMKKTSHAQIAIAKQLNSEGLASEEVTYMLGVDAMSRADFMAAIEIMSSLKSPTYAEKAAMDMALMHCLLAEFDQARAIIHDVSKSQSHLWQSYKKWLVAKYADLEWAE